MMFDNGIIILYKMLKVFWSFVILPLKNNLFIKVTKTHKSNKRYMIPVFYTGKPILGLRL